MKRILLASSLALALAACNDQYGSTGRSLSPIPPQTVAAKADILSQCSQSKKPMAMTAAIAAMTRKTGDRTTAMTTPKAAVAAEATPMAIP